MAALQTKRQMEFEDFHNKNMKKDKVKTIQEQNKRTQPSRWHDNIQLKNSRRELLLVDVQHARMAIVVKQHHKDIWWKLFHLNDSLESHDL